MTTKQKPAHEIRIGSIKATIWKNETEKGDRYNTGVSRLYRVEAEKREGSKDSGWRETQSFGREDLLVLAKVSDQAHTWILEQNGSDE